MTTLFTEKETWRSIINDAITTPIEASNLGRIRVASTSDIKKQSRTSDYYWTVYIDGKSHLVHRLVASAFYNRRILSTEFVCHRNDDGLNNRLSNIYIGSRQKNQEDRRRNDRAGITLRMRDVSRIRADHRPYAEIATEYCISRSHVGNIKNGRRWGWHR